MNFHGKAKKLDDVDLPRIAATIGVGEDEIHAVLEVETRGGGFDGKGRPKMLFEPHIFYRLLGAGPDRDRAVELGIAYRSWKSGGYPADSYPRLEMAMSIHKDIALQSASWGLGQIMGFNANAAGYQTATAMVKDFLDDEETHLEAMIKFIVTNDLDDELRRHDWKGFARGYNGPGYAKHGYHTKLQNAFRKWARIADTPFDSTELQRALKEPDVSDDLGYPVLKMGSRGGHVEILQKDLHALRYHVGKIDGIFGRGVRAAVVTFQIDHGLKPDGIAGDQTWSALSRAEPKPLRENVDLSKSRTRKAVDAQKKAAAVQGVAGPGAILAVTIAEAQSALDEVQAAGVVLDWMPYVAGLLVIAALGATWYSRKQSVVIDDARVEDAITGANVAR